MRILSVAFILVGAGVLVATALAGGGVVALGYVMGAAFVGIGAARLWLAARMTR